MVKLRYHCPGCGSPVNIEPRVPAAPRSVLAAVRCDICRSNSFLYATRCPFCGETNFAITSIHLGAIELQSYCQSCRNTFSWVTQ